MTFLQQFADIKRRVFMLHVRQEIVARFDDPQLITLEEYRILRMNSWERKLLLPKLDDEALLALVKYSLDNCQEFPAAKYEEPESIYDGALVRELLPELLGRQEFRPLVEG